MRLVTWVGLLLALAAALVYLRWPGGAEQGDADRGGADAIDAADRDPARSAREVDPAPSPRVVLQAAPSLPTAAAGAAQPATPPRLTPEQQAAREEWRRTVERDERLVEAGLLSADVADSNRLAALVGRRVSGELAEVEYQQARAEILVRQVTRRETAHAAGLLEERKLRRTRLELAAALAAAGGDAAAYATAWREHFDWLRAGANSALEAGILSESAARERVGDFLRGLPWPPEVPERAEQFLAPYLTPRWGWVQSLERGPAGVRRVRIVFGGATSLRPGRELPLWRGSVPVSTVRVEALERDGSVVVAEVLSQVPGSGLRVGDIATSD